MSSRQKHLLPTFKISCTNHWLCFLDRLAKQSWDLGSWGFSSTLRRWLMQGRAKEVPPPTKNWIIKIQTSHLCRQLQKGRGENPPTFQIVYCRTKYFIASIWLTHVTETTPYQVFWTVLLLGGDYPIYVTILHWYSIDCNLHFIQNVFDICTYTDGSDLLLPVVEVCSSNNCSWGDAGSWILDWNAVSERCYSLAMVPSTHTEKLPRRIIVRAWKTGR